MALADCTVLKLKTELPLSKGSSSVTIPTLACSQTVVETNLLIIVANVPLGGEMSYFRPWCERSRKTGGGRRKQYLGTAGAPGARLRRITPHQATKQGAMSLCMSAYARVVCERMSTSEKIEERE